MFDKSTDHGNDAKVAQFSCRVRISKKRQRKRTSKTVVKKTNRQQFSMVCALIDRRNDFQMLKALQWNHEPHLSFEQCDVISIGNCCQFVKMIMIMVLIMAMITMMMMIMIVMVMYIVEWCNDDDDDDDDDDNNGGGSGDKVGLDVLDMVIMTVGAINFGDVMMRMTIVFIILNSNDWWQNMGHWEWRQYRWHQWQQQWNVIVDTLTKRYTENSLELRFLTFLLFALGQYSRWPKIKWL